MARFVVALVLLILGRHVGSSAQVRNDKGFELREPRKESITLNQEERHKYIHDGKEYNRPPNLFDVGDGELKLLPEVLSGLSFETRDFKDDGTAAEQKELRDTRPWGRLHVDGWPAPIQYLRSHFGGPAVEGMRPVVLADPLDACEPLRNVDSIVSAVVIVTRGTCTYTTKARNAQQAAANALLIVNNGQGLLHPPGPDGMDLDIFSAMIPQAEGTALIETVVKNDPVQGALVPMNCNKHGGIGDKNQQCLAAVKADRDLVDGLALGGFVHLPGGEKFEYLLAEFGVKVPSGGLMLDGSPDPPGTACNPLTKEAADAAVGKAVLATRGECSFLEKAESMGAGGPSGRVGALIIANDDTSLFHMGASPRWRGAKVSFPTVLVSDIAGHALANLPPESTIRFTPSQDVTMAAWDEIGHLKEVSAWPADTQKRQRMYETLVAGNTAFPDRTSAVRAAFSAVSGGDRGGAAGRTVETGRDDAEWQDAVNSDATSASI
ncbi:unnamed protein product [Pylaiella littoralis]